MYLKKERKTKKQREKASKQGTLKHAVIHFGVFETHEGKKHKKQTALCVLMWEHKSGVYKHTSCAQVCDPSRGKGA